MLETGSVGILAILFIILIVSHIISPFVCAVMAKEKNKSEVAWFFLGLLLGLIALGILALSKGNEPPIQNQDTVPRMMAKGGQCAPQTKQASLDEIKKLKELLDAGLISQSEYDAKKKQLLGL